MDLGKEALDVSAAPVSVADQPMADPVVNVPHTATTPSVGHRCRRKSMQPEDLHPDDVGLAEELDLGDIFSCKQHVSKSHKVNYYMCARCLPLT